MKSFAAKHNKQIFDWQKFCVSAPTYYGTKAAQILALDYYTDPIGQMDERLERGWLGEPVDQQLFVLDQQFSQKLEKMRIALVLRSLAAKEYHKDLLIIYEAMIRRVKTLLNENNKRTDRASGPRKRIAAHRQKSF